MDVLGDLVARDRRSDEPLVRFGTGQTDFYTAHKFCTDAWKAASLFRYHGAGPGRAVAVADDREPAVLLSFFGAALLGAPVRFRTPGETDARLVVTAASTVGEWSVPPGCTRVAYGGEHDDPSVAHFERDVWSENPTMPPDGPDAGDPVLATDDRTYTHAELLTAAERVVDGAGLTADDEVALRAPLSDPGVVVAGVVAPLLVGARVLLPGDELVGTVAVTRENGDDEVPEASVVSPASAPL